MAVKNSTKPVIVDIDEVSQIQIITLLSGNFNPGPHVGLEVGETYGLNAVSYTHLTLPTMSPV